MQLVLPQSTLYKGHVCSANRVSGASHCTRMRTDENINAQHELRRLAAQLGRTALHLSSWRAPHQPPPITAQAASTRAASSTAARLAAPAHVKQREVGA